MAGIVTASKIADGVSLAAPDGVVEGDFVAGGGAGLVCGRVASLARSVVFARSSVASNCCSSFSRG
jgi:hypothetical protein